MNAARFPLWDALSDFLFPPRCPVCRAYVPERGAWCAACAERAYFPRVVRFAVGTGLAQIVVVCRYRGAAQLPIRKLKYRGDFAALPALRGMLDRAELLTMFPAIDAAVPVPLHVDKQRARGFNQDVLLFFDWAKQNGIAWEEPLERVKPTAPQYGLTPTERHRNLRGAFRLRPGAAVRGRTILLVDDIVTTGATLESCAAVLRRAGARQVCALALAGDCQT